MIRALHALTAVVLATGSLVTSMPACAQLSESPITPGFWSWPRERPTTPPAIVAACRDHFAVQFPNGRYFGVRMRTPEKATVPPQIDEVGHCQFDRDTQVERCDMTINNSDGTVSVGMMEARFSFDAEKTMKMTVAPKVVDGVASNAKPFDVFPVRCPDDAVWNALNDVTPAK
jgi:hypothetical protein